MTKRKNSKMFQVGTCESVNMDTGERTPIEGGGLRMLPGPPGSCEWCHVVHDKDQPHDKGSLPYQMKFQVIHGRGATWTDAMAHCAPEVQQMWRTQLVLLLKKLGKPIPPDLEEP